MALCLWFGRCLELGVKELGLIFLFLFVRSMVRVSCYGFMVRVIWRVMCFDLMARIILGVRLGGHPVHSTTHVIVLVLHYSHILSPFSQGSSPLAVATERREIYVAMQEKAKAAGEGSKVRRYQRIITQCDTGAVFVVLSLLSFRCTYQLKSKTKNLLQLFHSKY